MPSQERRRERYQIIFLWKLSQGMVDGYNLHFVNNPRRSGLSVVKNVNQRSTHTVRKAMESSLPVKGSKLFYILPREIRDIDSLQADHFKHYLDQYLMTIPDQPTIPGFGRAAATNSLLDQIPLTNLQ